MKILSLFDGMACGAIAFTKLGIPIDRYVAYEIDKYAVKVASHNFPYIEQRGDVFQADFTEFNDFDWLIGGSPCTYWSIAQKNNRETEASGLGWELFSQYVRALHEAKPKYFLYENNKSMSKEIKASITETFGFEPVLINSALVSAQNRQRLYWVGIRQADGTYRKADAEQPEDRGILLRDVLDSAVAEKRYQLSEPVNITADGKAQTLRATCYKDGIRNMVGNNVDRKTCVAEPVCVAQRGRYADTGNRSAKGNGPVEQFYEAREDGKTNAITTVQKDNAIAEPVRIANLGESGGQGQRVYSTDAKASAVRANGRQEMISEPVRVGTIESKAQNPDHDSKQYRVYSPDGKSTTICGQGGGVGAKTGLYAVPADGKTYPVYEVCNGLITIKDKQYPIKLADGFYIIRKLTVSECMRLQTVPEWYDFSVISNSQAYKCLGNGWTVDVITHLIQSAQTENAPTESQLTARAKQNILTSV